MNPPESYLPIEDESAQRMARRWLTLGLGALLAAGLFSLLLVLSRTPAIQDWIPWVDFFHVALVVHVDLSVLIWFLAFAGVLWSLGRPTVAAKIDPLAWLLVVWGTLMLISAPFIGAGAPLMNNYVPVLQHPWFYGALLCIGGGVLLYVVGHIYAVIATGGFNTFFDVTKGKQVFSLVTFLAAVTTLISLIAVWRSWYSMPDAISGAYYFEVLFWGGGHALQFTHTLLMLLAWVVLIVAAGGRWPLSPRWTAVLFFITFMPVLWVAVIYLSTDVESIEHRLAFTQLMKYGGLFSLPLGLIVSGCLLTLLFKKIDKALWPLRSALFCSLTLFAAGGIIGFLIEGINVVIPAHYHGSIVGVTLSFMGLTYLLLPKIGFGQPSAVWATRQPVIYGGGQLLHILGLAWSGGYGVQRKTAGAAQGLESLPEIAGMAMMGLGGLISIIGGVIFLLVTLSAMRNHGGLAYSRTTS